ncbi:MULTISPECIES: hypothetical protein [Weeksella]|uniref:Uncharacterized protein n=1 Tax=Weeksella virosa (strain ATCC 43766 / DSM 16922 / JCM 21250 / CCUG 30538 / CDC 9751 / IAM 14551 / NBRC 16016 / NCTC 11634 / CL345/78) TaxID=865938 RepID=F0NXA2_WEEVC|nr:MULTISPECIES: hypothetical protein [Weeksella]ADX66876.1 hypothetical protein Weevi_0152 [Weeksella virosa DSM 16922]MDK7376150.1 hypothetical protein [Weeksella virosa]VEH63397.1 Uncharacterised protein [Weeksella virosa]
MKKQRFLFLSVIVLTLLLALFVNFSGFIFAIALLILITLFSLILIIKLIKGKQIKRLLKFTVTYSLIFIFGIIINLFIPYEKVSLGEDATLSQEIQQIYKSDQSDRKLLKTYLIPENKKEVIERDNLRLEKAKNIYLDYTNGKEQLNNQDKFNLAMILHHGKTKEDFEIAHNLAKQVANSDNKIQNAEWLEKATYDRLQLSQGKPQKYGTQH